MLLFDLLCVFENPFNYPSVGFHVIVHMQLHALLTKPIYKARIFNHYYRHHHHRTFASIYGMILWRIRLYYMRFAAYVYVYSTKQCGIYIAVRIYGMELGSHRLSLADVRWFNVTDEWCLFAIDLIQITSYLTRGFCLFIYISGEAINVSGLHCYTINIKAAYPIRRSVRPSVRHLCFLSINHVSE